MPKPPKISDDPLVMKVRMQLRKIEPREMPTETMINDYGHKGWKCPYCEQYVNGAYKTTYRNFGMQTVPDYSQYNMHFAAHHATPFWKEKQLIKLMKKELKNAA